VKGVTLDSISMRGAGVVTIAQPAKGHRFTLDSVLLADFCRIKTRDRILEPGAGTGVISNLLAQKFPSVKVTALELQSNDAGLCRRNTQANELQKRISVIEGDIRSLKGKFALGSFDVIVANPPYSKSRSGRQSPDPSRRIARHDESGDLQPWLDLQVFLKNKGRLFFIFAASGAAELLSSMRDRNLEPKRLRFVHSYASKPASIVLVEAVKSAGVGLEVLAPLVVHEPGGGYSEKMRQIYGFSGNRTNDDEQNCPAS
jgi:tRNA1(Val) A37 N6-methylase TrmN6